MNQKRSLQGPQEFRLTSAMTLPVNRAVPASVDAPAQPTQDNARINLHVRRQEEDYPTHDEMIRDSKAYKRDF